MLSLILQKHQKFRKFEYLYSSFVYSMSDDVVYYIDFAMFLTAKKQRSFGSFVNKVENQRLKLKNQCHEDTK